MAAVLGNMKEPLTKSVHEVVIPSIAMNFLLGGRPKWRQLSPERISARRSASPILIDKRKLLNAAVGKTTWRITDTEANMERIDEKVPYAKYHQSGTSKMPRRQFAILHPRDVDDIVDVFSEWLAGVTIEHGNWPAN